MPREFIRSVAGILQKKEASFFLQNPDINLLAQ